MADSNGRRLADLLAQVERKKADSLRARLGIPPHLRIEGIQLEGLAYHLTERSGTVHLRLEDEALRVGESETAVGIRYHGDAVSFLLDTWGVTREAAQRGLNLELENGRKVA